MSAAGSNGLKDDTLLFHRIIKENRVPQAFIGKASSAGKVFSRIQIC
jgi:hypothetical protein